MNAPRSKQVVVGGREFVVRPMLGKTARDLAATEVPNGMDGLVKVVALVLQRTDPTVTAEWLLENGDVAEYGDVMAALSEVSGGAASKGEAAGP